MPLSLVLVTPPVAEPITLFQAKLQCGFGPMDDSDHIKARMLADQLRPFMVAARQSAENYMNRAIFNQTWKRTLDHFPLWWAANGTVNPSYRRDWPYYSDFWNRISIDIPWPMTSSVTSITYLDTSGATQTLPSSQYNVDLTSTPARIVPALGTYWPSEMTYVPGSVAITFVAGSYGDGVNVNTCPQAIAAAILLIVQQLYKLSEPGMVSGDLICPAAKSLLDLYKVEQMCYRPE